MDIVTDGFSIASGKGFRIVVNGWALSVQFGPGNYCDNRYEDSAKLHQYAEEHYYPCYESRRAEIALWRGAAADEVRATMERLTEHDNVAGYVTAVQVATILGILAAENQTYGDVMEAVRAVLGEKSVPEGL